MDKKRKLEDDNNQKRKKICDKDDVPLSEQNCIDRVTKSSCCVPHVQTHSMGELFGNFGSSH
jgi:hypothetical protein